MKRGRIALIIFIAVILISLTFFLVQQNYKESQQSERGILNQIFLKPTEFLLNLFHAGDIFGNTDEYGTCLDDCCSDNDCNEDEFCNLDLGICESLEEPFFEIPEGDCFQDPSLCGYTKTCVPIEQTGLSTTSSDLLQILLQIFTTANSESIPQEGAVLIDFHASWCPPCQRMHSVIDKLSASGYPTKKINADPLYKLPGEPGYDPSYRPYISSPTAKQYGIGSLPTFMIFVNGKPVETIVGAQSYERLEQSIKNGIAIYNQEKQKQRQPLVPPLVQPPIQPPVQPVIPEKPAKKPTLQDILNHLNFFKHLLEERAEKSREKISEETPEEAIEVPDYPIRVPEDKLVNPGAGELVPVIKPKPEKILESCTSDDNGKSCVCPKKVSGQYIGDDKKVTNEEIIKASVKINIKYHKGSGVGSGTIIHTQNGEALIASAWHLFRNYDSNSEITIELEGYGNVKVKGNLLRYKAEEDVSLIAITLPKEITVTPAKVAPKNYEIKKGDIIYTSGCSEGKDCTVEQSLVNSIGKYLGAKNFQTQGVPIEGRSGGGVFSDGGYLIGIINAADPPNNEGIISHLENIQILLDYQDSKNPAAAPSLSWVYNTPETSDDKCLCKDGSCITEEEYNKQTDTIVPPKEIPQGECIPIDSLPKILKDN